MNIFRFIADMLHLAAILTLLYRIKVSRLTWTPLSIIATSMVSQHLADHLFTLLVTKLFREKSAEDGGLGQ